MSLDEFEELTEMRISAIARFVKALSLPHGEEYETLLSGTYRATHEFKDLAAGIEDLVVRPGFSVSELSPLREGRSGT